MSIETRKQASKQPDSNCVITECTTVGQILKGSDFLEQITKRFQEYKLTGQVSLSGLSTGYNRIDEILDGFQQGNLITLGARTGMGKTWVALNLLKKISIDQKIPAAFFSLEMSNQELINRLLALCSGIPALKIKKGRLDELEFNEVLSAYEILSSPPLYLNDNSDNGFLPELERNLNNMCEKVKFIIIDHVGLITTKNTTNNRTNEVGDITRAIKLIAKKHKIPIMIIAQLNRNADKDEKPKLSDLRESGSIEQDSDVVIFCHRSDYYNKEKNPGQMDIIIEKNRHGEDKLTLPFSYDQTTWSLMEGSINENQAPRTSDSPVRRYMDAANKKITN